MEFAKTSPWLKAIVVCLQKEFQLEAPWEQNIVKPIRRQYLTKSWISK